MSRLKAEISLPLPPPDVWRFSPQKNERLPTPTDERGLVDTKRLLATVASTVEPDFNWQPSEKPDIHHLYWEHNRYPNTPESSINPEAFCNLAVSRILLPRMFHNWLHLVTEEPPVPDKEIMYYQIEAQRIVQLLFANARQTKRLLRSRYITDERLIRGMNYHFEEFCLKLEEARNIPEEFHPINFHEYNPSTADDLHDMARTLGKFAMAKTIHQFHFIDRFNQPHGNANGATLVA